MEKDNNKIAEQLAQLFSDDESMKRVKEDFHEYLQRLKSLMSCYQCALMEVETKFKVLDVTKPIRMDSLCYSLTTYRAYVLRKPDCGVEPALLVSMENKTFY